MVLAVLAVLLGVVQARAGRAGYFEPFQIQKAAAAQLQQPPARLPVVFLLVVLLVVVLLVVVLRLALLLLVVLLLVVLLLVVLLAGIGTSVKSRRGQPFHCQEPATQPNAGNECSRGKPFFLCLHTQCTPRPEGCPQSFFWSRSCCGTASTLRWEELDLS